MSSFFGAWIAGKRRRRTAMISAGLVDGERRLRDVGEPRVRREVERLRLGDVLHEHRRLGRLAHRAHDLLVAGMADQDDRVAVRRVTPRLHVHLRHERAGRVDHVVAERLRTRRARTARRRAPRRRSSRRPAPPPRCRRRSRRAPRGRGRRGCCARSACARRRAGRSARARARPSRPLARRRRSSRAVKPGERARPSR